MFHRKQSKQVAVLLLALLLTFALTLAAAAQTTVPPIGDPQDTPVSTTNPPGGPQPTATGGPPALGTPTATPTSTTGTPGGDMGGGSGAAPATWPSPNAIVHHAATPIQISALGGGLRVYYVGPDSVTTGELLPTLSALAEMYPDGDNVSLVDTVHQGTGKPVMIQYLPNAMKLHVSTFYADKPPHDYNKPYIFTVDADHSVTHEAW